MKETGRYCIMRNTVEEVVELNEKRKKADVTSWQFDSMGGDKSYAKHIKCLWMLW